MIKHILVNPETHYEVDKIRAEHKLKTFDEAIKHLLARPDFTEDERVALARSIDFSIDADNSCDDPALYIARAKLE